MILFEDPLFFGDPHYPARMHRQKLWLHRASMARYRQELESRGFEAGIFPYERNTGACLHLFERLSRERIDRVASESGRGWGSIECWGAAG